MLLGVQHSELVQRLSDKARPRELQQEEAKATDRSVHFVTLAPPGLTGGLPGVGVSIERGQQRNGHLLLIRRYHSARQLG